MNSHAGAWELGVSWEDIFCVLPKLSLAGLSRLKWVAEDFNSSWKLKRNLDLLNPTITQYLDDFKNKKMEDLKVTFAYKGKSQIFTALADVIFVVK